MNLLDEPIFIAVSKPLLTEFGIHYRLESCVAHGDMDLPSLAKVKKQYGILERMSVIFKTLFRYPREVARSVTIYLPRKIGKVNRRKFTVPLGKIGNPSFHLFAPSN